MNPFIVLGVPRDADDQRIRQAYLEAIKEATPETNPTRFKAVSEAYERIKDETSRHKYSLFNTDCPGDSPLDVFLKHLNASTRPAAMSFENMKEFLRSCSKM